MSAPGPGKSLITEAIKAQREKEEKVKKKTSEKWVKSDGAKRDEAYRERENDKRGAEK